MAGGTAPRGGVRALRLALRIALAVALVVLLGLNGVKQAPRLAALVAPAPAATETTASAAPVGGAASAAATPSTTSTPVSSTTASLGTTTGGSGSGGTTGGGSTGGGTTGGTSPKPSATTLPGAVITALYADSGADCLPKASDAPGAEAPPAPDVTVHWRSTGGVGDAWFGVNTSDAKAAPYSTVHQSDSITLTFPCSEASQRYTVTVQSQSGALVSRSITVRNTGTVG